MAVRKLGFLLWTTCCGYVSRPMAQSWVISRQDLSLSTIFTIYVSYKNFKIKIQKQTKPLLFWNCVQPPKTFNLTQKQVLLWEQLFRKNAVWMLIYLYVFTTLPHMFS